jgi:hypothetical protein
MTSDSLSNQIVMVASFVMGTACLVVAFGAFRAWRLRSNDRMKKRIGEISQQLRAVTDRLQPTEGPIHNRREILSA